MPARLNFFAATKAASALRQSTARSAALPIRSRVQQAIPVQRRWNSSKDDPKNLGPEEQTFPSQDPLPHVSEEAAEIDRIMNKEKSCDGQPSSPELEQGSPIEEILQRNKDGMKHMPKVMQEQVKKSNGSRSFSTSARSRLPEEQTFGANEDASAAVLAGMIKEVNQGVSERAPGFKFDEPDLTAKTLNFRRRYDSLQEQFTKMMMEDGKLAKAQKVCYPQHICADDSSRTNCS